MHKFFISTCVALAFISLLAMSETSHSADCIVLEIEAGSPIIYSATITSGTYVMAATGTLSGVGRSLCPDVKQRGWFERIGDCFKCLAGAKE